ncbi:GTPase Era, mitochondrial [Austrofundulus limnaeus]|uniref:GTPase Era, mitochondrial n=1 Tax=Austrofundulus limnaeus TaxID=52670 RepID=A0A2I4D4U0_AUSLI|nr:PREDICTED: GTPase Era, mitochondrial [Austrofundulus limnaeus]
MALRVCGVLFRDVSVLSRRLIVSARQETASCFLTAGSAACSRGRRNGLSFTPACFISSEAFLKRLIKSKVEADGSTDHLPNSVPTDSSKQLSLLLRDPDPPPDSKVLKVAIIGAPNAGKSTLSNQILGRKVFAVSKKVHTTRSRSLAVLTENNTQIILLDTPGFVTKEKVKKHKLEQSLLVDPWNTVKEADLIVVMVDVSDKWMNTKLDFEVLKCLAEHSHIPAILVLNKVDLLKKKDRLLEITAQLTAGVVNGRRIQVRPVIKPPQAEKIPEKITEWDSEASMDEDPPAAEDSRESASALSKEKLKELRRQKGWSHFKDVFMLSSLDKEDVETLKSYFEAAAKPEEWEYHSEVLTDQSPQDVCTNIIREKLLEYLPEEVPYSVQQSIELWCDREEGKLDISVKLHISKENHMKMVIGSGGQMVNRIAKEACEDLCKLYMREVTLKLVATLKKGEDKGTRRKSA